MDRTTSFEVIRARYSFNLGMDSVLDMTHGDRVADMFLDTDQLSMELAGVDPEIHYSVNPQLFNVPPTPNNSFDLRFGILDPRLSVLSNLYLSNQTLPNATYEEEEAQENIVSSEMVQENVISNEIVGYMEVSASGSSPPSSASAPSSPLNPEAAPFIPHLKAFSAPSSPDPATPSLVPIRPSVIHSNGNSPVLQQPAFDEAAVRRIIGEVFDEDNVTVRQTDRVGADQATALSSSERSTVPVTGIKRRRTLTTSSCGPDLAAALQTLANNQLTQEEAGQPGEIAQYYADQFVGGGALRPSAVVWTEAGAAGPTTPEASSALAGLSSPRPASASTSNAHNSAAYNGTPENQASPPRRPGLRPRKYCKRPRTRYGP